MLHRLRFSAVLSSRWLYRALLGCDWHVMEERVSKNSTITALAAEHIAAANGTKKFSAKAAKLKSSNWYRDAARSIGISKSRPPQTSEKNRAPR
jgi:hypothetical protein